MSIEITLSCDASGCFNTRDISDNRDVDIERVGFHVHPYDGVQHYCNKCWPQVEKELEED